tara:strand:+ start:355 stop:540 length:186 start_codon:yes stop_codon:yes gene_type:complete
MPDKIKAARSRAQANGDSKKKTEDRASWFDEHVVVIGADTEQEDKIKKALQASMATGNSGG